MTDENDDNCLFILPLSFYFLMSLSRFAGVYIDEVTNEDALDCNGWSSLIQAALFISAAGLVLVLAAVAVAACCLKYRNKMTVIPSGNAKLSVAKQLSDSEWLAASPNKKADHLYGQTRLPGPEQFGGSAPNTAADGNGVYICPLSASQFRPATTQQQQMRNLQGPDLLDLCRTSDQGRDVLTGLARPATRVILDSNPSLRQSKPMNGRSTLKRSSPSDDGSVQIPFCYYFE